jgi:hypothetical protein
MECTANAIAGSSKTGLLYVSCGEPPIGSTSRLSIIAFLPGTTAVYVIATTHECAANYFNLIWMHDAAGILYSSCNSTLVAFSSAVRDSQLLTASSSPDAPSSSTSGSSSKLSLLWIIVIAGAGGALVVAAIACFALHQCRQSWCVPQRSASVTPQHPRGPMVYTHSMPFHGTSSPSGGEAPVNQCSPQPSPVPLVIIHRASEDWPAAPAA